MKTHKGLVKVRCECGDEILLLPDLKEMGKAIEDHVDLHLQHMKASSCTPAEAERLKDILIAQVLNKAGKSEEEENQQ
jgi:hypothetical protein